MNAWFEGTNGRRNALIVLAVMVFVIFTNAIDRGIDLLFFPWTFARPPLLDEWVGRLTTGHGVRMIVALELRRDLTDTDEICVRCNQIEGSAVTCDPRGTVLRYRISGSPKDRKGRQLHLGAIPEPQPPPDGLELDTLSGTWDGADVLALNADFFWRRAGAGISASDDPANQPVPIRLERKAVAAFDGMCAALR